MKYEDQLASARYRAERDQARQELERERHLRKLAESAAAERETVRAEDHEAAEWVREHGGLDVVEDSIKTNEWALSLALIAHDALFGEDSERDTTPTEFKRELRRRLMPEGMEWPRYESGELVLFGDEFVNAKGNASTLRTIAIKDCRDALGGAVFWKLGKGACAVTLENGERVKRLAPKVLDADGAECHVGDHGYWLDQPGVEVIIKHIDPREMSQLTVYDVHGRGNTISAEEFTHRAPVIAADGRPLREGETVWDVDGHGPLTVWGLPDKSDMHVSLKKDGTFYYRYSEKLTHERPVADTWERLEEDARNIRTAIPDSDKLPFEVIDERALDLVRRARALVERGE